MASQRSDDDVGHRRMLGSLARPRLYAVLLVAFAASALLVAGIGLIAAYLAARALATMLYGLSVHDAVSFVAAPMTLAAVALVACVAPCLRAMRIDPVKQLRG